MTIYSKSGKVKSDNIEKREMRINALCNAPIDLIWKVWTMPKYIVNWWGPDGFTSTTQKMDFWTGGEWKLTLHGPDGTNFPNRSVYQEVIPFNKIVFEHFNPHFITTVLFEDQGEKTRIDWKMLFDTAEMRETIVKVHKADEGQRQNIERLNKYLFELQRE